MKHMMLFYFICCLSYVHGATEPATWPPAWASTTHGGTLGASDDHTGADYGQDSYGYWANLDVLDAGNNVVATVEMRYITPDVFFLGAHAGEFGARHYETQRLASIIPNPIWISALECTQLLWEETHKLATPGFEMRLKKWDDSDIHEMDTAAFPVDPSGFTGDVDASGVFLRLDDVDAWEDSAPGNFRAQFDAHKIHRAIESQTFENCKTFCEDMLQNQIRSQPGGSGVTIRLPSESEWEYVCRGGSDGPYWTGPMLTNVDFSMKDITVDKSDFMFPFDSEHINDHITDALGGDGALHREWFTQSSDVILVESVTRDGVATASGSLNRSTVKDIAGTISMSGKLAAVPVVANFDERYQPYYLPNKYGSHTPVLMTYTFDGVKYIPAPYASAPAADIYYKVLGRDAYYLSTTINVTNTKVNKSFRKNSRTFRICGGCAGRLLSR